MQKIRTRHFFKTLRISAGISALFLVWIALFGKGLAQQHFQVLTDAVFAVMLLAAGSFLLFSFFPYFKGDRRWYSISALLTVTFLIGTRLLWQIPVAGGF
ncbi:MAG: hypothetical protein IJX28_02900 [Clostridia bacterium]|nr:hypothetical protein [Clostridia bacterium]